MDTHNYIERYICAVARRLPESEREELRRELRANIHDMLPDAPTDEEIRSVLLGLGDPKKLAESYRAKPRYLISPASYDSYIRALKLVVPLVGGILLVVGAVLGAVEFISGESLEVASFISSVLSSAISIGVSGAFQALFWTTAGFVIAERTGARVESEKEEPWSPESLPEINVESRRAIPLSDSIAELCVTAIFAAVAITVCLGRLPFAFVISSRDIEIFNIFSSEFLRLYLPLIAVMAALGIAEAIIKIVRRRWSALTCAATLVSELSSCGIMLYLLTRPNMLHEDFSAFLSTQEWGSADLMRLFEVSPINPIALVIAIIVVVATIASCVSAVVKTVRAPRA